MRDTGTPRSARLGPWCTGLALVLMTVWVWRGITGLELLGWDTYPLIAAGRVDGVAAFFGTFTEKLMDGRYPLGSYWRPIVHLSFAFDYALAGLEPAGYHRTDLALVAACALAIASLTRRLGGRSFPELGAFVAGAAFVLHAVHFDVLTVPARRAESLAVLFTVSSLVVAAASLELSATDARRSRVRLSIAAGLLAALALASKETGVVAVPLVALLVAVTRSRPSRKEVAVFAGVVGFAFVLRTFALGGLGGGEDAAIGFGATRAVGTLTRNLALSLGGVTGAIAVGLAVAAGLFTKSRAADAPLSAARLVVFVTVWWLVLAVVTGMAGIDQDWYAFPFAAATACAVGRVAGEAWCAARRATGAARIVASSALLVSSAWFASNASDAGLGDAGEDYRVAGDETTRFLHAFEARVDEAVPGTEIDMQAAFEWAVVDQDGALVRRIHPFGAYSLESYAELAIPGRSVRVSTPRRPSPRPVRADDVHVIVRPVPRIRRR